jgi:Tfp pilus assembly protein PilN
MIRTNLSTRPFYNVRAVHAAILALAAIVLAVTVFNVVQIIRLSTSQRTLGAQAQAAEDDAARLRAEAVQFAGRVDPEELAVVAKAAAEANAIIDQRTFPWTDLFAYFEATLPENVRITAVQQGSGTDDLIIGAQARSYAELDDFIEALEMTGAFRDVIPTDETSMEAGYIDATIQGTYTPPARRAEVAP